MVKQLFNQSLSSVVAYPLCECFEQNKYLFIYNPPEDDELETEKSSEKNLNGFIFRCPMFFRKKPHPQNGATRSELIYAALGVVKRDFYGVL